MKEAMEQPGRLIGTQNNQILDLILESIANSETMIVVTGYLNSSGLQLIIGQIKQSGCKTTIYAGKFIDLDKIAEMLSNHPDIQVKLVRNPGQFMHAKMYLFSSGSKGDAVIIGSSNLTYGGLLHNFELNVYQKLEKKDKKKINQYIKQLQIFSTDITNTEEIELMGTNAVKARLCNELNDFFGDADQQLVKDWEKEITDMQKHIKRDINRVIEGEWDASEFRDRHLMECIWAITEARHTGLWAQIKGTDSDKLFKSIHTMILEAEKKAIDDDMVIAHGRIFQVFGDGILSEILHKYFIERFPIRNKRSAWGVIVIYDDRVLPQDILQDIHYSQFKEYCDELYPYFKEWFTERKIKLDDKYKYFYLDRLFLSIFESKKYQQTIKIYYSSS